MSNRNLILIDGQNMAHRMYWAFQQNKKNGASALTFNSQETSIIFGFLKQLVVLGITYPDSDIVVAWDSKSLRRIAETDKAKKDGLIESGYKEGRKGMDEEEKESFFNQVAHLQTDILTELSVMQVSITGFEADDIIYSYTLKYPNRPCVIVSGDRDFYQALSENVKIHNMQKKEIWTLDKFIKEYGFKPSQYIDYGALVGEGAGGDNIPGVDGCGHVGAKNLVCQYGSIGEILKALALKAPYTQIKEKKPRRKKGDPIPETIPMRSKMEEEVFNSVDKISLSYSLKKMDFINVPDVTINPKKIADVKKMLIKWGCVSILKDASHLCGSWYEEEMENIPDFAEAYAETEADGVETV